MSRGKYLSQITLAKEFQKNAQEYWGLKKPSKIENYRKLQEKLKKVNEGGWIEWGLKYKIEKRKKWGEGCVWKETQ